MVADHQAQRQRADHDHAGRRAEPTEECEQRERVLALRQRQRQHEQVRRHAAAGQKRFPRARQRQYRQRDQQQVQRKLPACGAHRALVPAFDNSDVKLVRQDEHREGTEQYQRCEPAGRRRRHGMWWHMGERTETQPDEGAQCQHRRQLEDRLERHRQHQPAIVFSRTGTARAEQHREQRHHQRHVEGAVLPCRQRRFRIACRQHRKAHRHRLELQRDVRDQAKRCNQRHRRGEPRILAQACRDQVGDRRCVRLPRQPHQPHHEAAGQRVQQDRAEECRWQRPPITRRLRDRAVERPRRAMHRKRQCINVMPMPDQHVRMALAIHARAKQQSEPQHGREDDDADAQHRRDGGRTDERAGWGERVYITGSTAVVDPSITRRRRSPPGPASPLPNRTAVQKL